MNYKDLPKDFEGYKARLIAQRWNWSGLNKIMAEAEQCGNLTTDEYLELSDIAAGRE